MYAVRRLALAAAAILLAPLFARAGDAKKDKLLDKVSYYKDVRPIFMIHCQGCHQPAKAEGGFIMSSHTELFKTGDHEEPGIVAGQPGKSMIVKMITPRDGKPAE